MISFTDSSVESEQFSLLSACAAAVWIDGTQFAAWRTRGNDFAGAIDLSGEHVARLLLLVPSHSGNGGPV